MEDFLEKIKDKAYVCLDAGSTHQGKLSYVLELVETAKECGADSIKFQMGVKDPNIDLPFDYFVKAFERGKEIGIDVTSSVFDHTDQYRHLLQEYLCLEPAFYKMAFS